MLQKWDIPDLIGLKDYGITNIFIDSSRTVWAIPIMRRPCYYNTVKDKFENKETNKPFIAEFFITDHDSICYSTGLWGFYGRIESSRVGANMAIYQRGTDPLINE